MWTIVVQARVVDICFADYKCTSTIITLVGQVKGLLNDTMRRNTVFMKEVLGAVHIL